MESPKTTTGERWTYEVIREAYISLTTMGRLKEDSFVRQAMEEFCSQCEAGDDDGLVSAPPKESPTT